MPRKPKEPTIPPQLFGLGLLMEGEDADPTYVRTSLAAALRDADAALMALGGSSDDLPFGMLNNRMAETRNFKAIEVGLGLKGEKPLGDLVDDALSEALWLGLALGHRFFAGGVR